MSQVITWELRFLLKALLLGLCLRGAYDVFKIRRGLTKRHPALMASEDTIYWIFCSLFLFGLLYEENNGTLRGFAICGTAAGGWQCGFRTEPHFGGGSSENRSVCGENFEKTRQILGKALKKMISWFRMRINTGERRQRHAEKNDSKRAQKKKTVQ